MRNVISEESTWSAVSTHPGVTHGPSSNTALIKWLNCCQSSWKSRYYSIIKWNFGSVGKAYLLWPMFYSQGLTLFMETYGILVPGQITTKSSSCNSYRTILITFADWGCQEINILHSFYNTGVWGLEPSWAFILTILSRASSQVGHQKMLLSPSN